MTKYIEQRNEKMRERYRKLFKQFKREKVKNASDKAIEELVRIYNVHELSFDTVKKIVHDSNYGRQKNGEAKE